MVCWDLTLVLLNKLTWHVFQPVQLCVLSINAVELKGYMENIENCDQMTSESWSTLSSKGYILAQQDKG